ADAEDHGRTMAANELPRLHESERQARQVANEVSDPLPFQSADGDEFEGKPAFRHDGLFEAVLRPDEDDAAIAAAAHPLLRDGDGGVDMAAGPPTRNHQGAGHRSAPQ